MSSAEALGWLGSSRTYGWTRFRGERARVRRWRGRLGVVHAEARRAPSETPGSTHEAEPRLDGVLGQGCPGRSRCGGFENRRRNELRVVPHGAVAAARERDEAGVRRQLVSAARLRWDQSILIAPGDHHRDVDVLPIPEALPP